MKPFPRFLLSALLCATAGNAVAASSVDLSVTGLITPSACTPSLSNGGTVDYGKISAKDLAVEDITELEIRKLAFSVACEASTLVALQATDNRAGSSYTGPGRMFGLGYVNGTERLGDMAFTLSNLSADGYSRRSIKSRDNGATWGTSFDMSPNHLMSVADDTTVAPIPLVILTGNIEFNTYIAPTSKLTLGNELLIDGSATLTVRYL